MRYACITALVALSVLPDCTKYQYAKNVKMISYEDNVAVGKAVGPVRGEICQARIMGYPVGDAPTLDRAMAAARSENGIRYVNNISSETTGFDTGFYGKMCLSVKGTGYE